MNQTVASSHSPITWVNRLTLAALLAIPVGVWLIGLGEPLAYLSHRVPTGQILYLFSKLFALYALAFMTAQVLIGVGGRDSRYFHLHPLTGALSAVFVLLHLSTFLIAATLRSKHSALETLIPVFDKGFFKLSVSIGVIAAYLLIAVVISGLLLARKWSGIRYIHYFAYAVVALGFIHSFFIGTETRQPVIIGYYAMLLAAVLMAIIRRFASSSNLKSLASSRS